MIGKCGRNNVTIMRVDVCNDVDLSGSGDLDDQATVRFNGIKIAAKRDQMTDAVPAILRKNFKQAFACGPDARQVRRRGQAFADHFDDGAERTLARRSAGAVRNGKERGLQLGELRARCA